MIERITSVPGERSSRCVRKNKFARHRPLSKWQNALENAKTPHTKAFTLVEMLIVIAIIAVLAALLFPAIGSLTRKSQGTACSNNLRQIGVAMNLYLADNQGTLPGTLWGSAFGQQPYVYDANNGSSIGRTLGRWLQPYLESKASANGSWEESKMFKCPVFMKALPSGFSRADPKPYVANNGDDGSIVDELGNKLRPFGLANGANPMRLLAMADRKALSQLWMLQDLDTLNLASGASAPRWIPPTPVHGNVRNTLFFDWHVEPVRVP